MFLLLTLALAPLAPQEVAFERSRLSDRFHAEGAAIGDLDRDGHADVVVGPHAWLGPNFERRLELYPGEPFDPLGYSDSFFAWTPDLDGDGWLDVLMVGFPGKAAFWLENPGQTDAGWTRHLVLARVNNESPSYTDLTGDGRRELVFHLGGRFGYAHPDPEDPRAPWTFVPVTGERGGLSHFIHGLGVGDVDGDGRMDILERRGWFRQGEQAATPWTFHPADFSVGRRGGAQMFVDDLDQDGDGDVITSLDGHGWGLSWFENDGGQFTEHRIMDGEASDNPRGMAVSQLHALAYADVDADGLKDIVTGKRFWAHGPSGDPGSDQAAVLMWLRQVRRDDGAVEFVPYPIDFNSGVGTQVTVGDVNGDERLDVVVGNKKGAFVFKQTAAGEVPRTPDGRKINLDLEAGTIDDWRAEGDAFEGQPIRGDASTARGRERAALAGDFWIGGHELHGDERTGRLVSAPFRIDAPWASFLIGGGSGHGTRVELAAVDGEVLFQSSGADYESMQRVIADLRAHRGLLVEVRVIDEATGPWGHVNFDDLRLHQERPSFPRDPAIPEIFPPDVPRPAGFAPDEAAAEMTLDGGFVVELIAGEPDLHQPVTFTFDARGRLWVVEAHSYPTKRGEGQGEDRILVLEDADLDGSFETRTVFADDLDLISGLEVGFGGVWVGQAPELLFIPDRDDDLIPDGPAEVLLDGFGYQDTHETLNAFTFGPDGWLYGCHGVFTHSVVGTPGAPISEREPINAGVWRYHPTRREFEVFAWGTSNPWGLDFDDRGQAFITACVIPHLYHVIQGGRYQRQAGSHFGDHVYTELQTIADHRHYLGDSPHGGTGRSDAAGGGHAHCGAMIYQGGAFPPAYSGRIYMANIHGNRINTDLLERDGSGFVGRHGPDFLLANDAWFRAVCLKYGPDGAVYVADWYDEQACHLTDPVRWDRSNGRLYRVSHGPAAPARVDLPDLEDVALARMQLHDNEWFARRARIVLQERGLGAEAAQLLRVVLKDHEDETRRLRALWTLHVCDALDEAALLAVTSDRGEYMRAWAVQLLGEARDLSPRALARMQALAGSDPSPVVRLYLASALQRLPSAQRWDLAGALLAHAEDLEDPNMPAMLWYAIEPLVAEDTARALDLTRGGAFDELDLSAARRAAATADLRDGLVEALGSEADPARRKRLLEAAVLALQNQRDVPMPEGWPAVAERLSTSADPLVRSGAEVLSVVFGDTDDLSAMIARLADPEADRKDREQALASLVQAGDPGAAPAIRALLGESELAGAALRALANFDDPETPAAILEVFPGLSREARRDALNTLASRPTWSAALLLALDEGRLPRTEVDAFVVRQIRGHMDADLEAQLQRVWGVVRETPQDKADRVAELRAALTPERLAAADLPRGRALFARTCQQCHTLFGAGDDVGPELTGSNRADLDYLLHNLVDPSAEVGLDYQATVVWLHDGRVVTGLLVEENETALVLRTENDTVVVSREDVDEARPSDLSTMPDGLLDALSEQDIADLVAYLVAPAQTPRLALPGDEAELFDGETLAGWRGEADLWAVRDGVIIGRSEGLGHNAFLRSELELRDFRLTLQVRLSGDAGNSGIQFRSRELQGGDVAGYQADIGPGWWGKLYEEHGRGVLHGAGGAEHVRRGEWNRYTIEAVGSRVRTWINGELCVDVDDPQGARGGILALQIHSGGPTEVSFRELELQLIDPEQEDAR